LREELRADEASRLLEPLLPQIRPTSIVARVAASREHAIRNGYRDWIAASGLLSLSLSLSLSLFLVHAHRWGDSRGNELAADAFNENE